MDNLFDTTSAGGFRFPFTEDEKDLLEIRKEIIRESLSDVYDEASRFKTITSIKSVDYVNDSQAITIDNTGSSLLRCFKPVTWIVAQTDSFTNYEDISEIVEEKVKSIICLSNNVNDVFSAYGNSKAQLVINADTIEEAVKIAAIITKPGEMVLFSPASTVDKDAGRAFNKAVRALKKGL